MPSQSVLIRQQQTSFTRARATNDTASSFASRIPTVTEPTGTGVLNTSGADLLIVPFGVGSDNQTGSVRVIGWRAIDTKDQQNTQGRTLWIPVILAEVVATLSAAVGIAGAIIDETNRFADTLTLTTGNDDVSVDFTSPTGDVIAHIVVKGKGFEKVEVTHKVTTATSLNSLVAML